MTSTSRALDRLRHNVLTETLTDEEFAAVKGDFTEHYYPDGTIILEDETEGGDLFLIVQGRVRITKRGRTGPETLLALLHPGDFFGELELIDGRPRAARVTAADECIIYSISRKAFEQLLSQNPRVASRLLLVLSIRLRTVDNQLVQELEHAANATRGEISRQKRIIEAAKVLNSTLDLDKLLRVILETALGLVDGDRGTVYIVDRERDELWSRVLKGEEHIEIRMPTGSGIAGYVAATGDTLNIGDAYYDPRFNPEIDKRSGYRTRSILCMPMKNRDGTIVGVFQLLNKRSGTFTAEDEAILGALSVHAAIALENARLHEQERQKIAMEKDLQAAREVQMMLIPKRLPEVEGYEFAATTIPAREVGGDLYDFTAREGSQLAICLGDVSGKGLAASLLMANVQATLRDQTLSGESAAECVRRSNVLLHENTSIEKFVTLFYAILNPRTATLTYCNAGHERPYHISPGGGTRRLNAGGIVLGITEDFAYEQATVEIEPGDLIVVFSDGVSEAMNPKEEQLGEEAIEQVARQHMHESAEAVKVALLGAVRTHAAGAPQADDITVVVLRRKP